MTTFHKLLCPIDFSEGSTTALRVAAQLAARDNAELVIAHSVYTPVYLGELPYPADLVQRMTDDAAAGLELAVRDVQALGVKRASSKLLSGVPWAQLTDFAKDDPDIDLIVVGTHGRTGVKRFLLGSMTEKIVRHAPCSVLAVHSENRVARWRHVLCPVDFSPSARLAAELATKMVDSDGPGVVLVHAVEALPAYAGEPSMSGFISDLEHRAAEQLDRWVDELRTSTTASLGRRTRIGNPAAQILSILDDEPGFDLVVIGSRGHTGLTRLLLGSVAERVVRHARCPVLVARTRDDKRAGKGAP